MHLTFKWTNATTVDDHQQNNGIALNSFNLPTTQSGLTADEYGALQRSAEAVRELVTAMENLKGQPAS